MNGRLAALLALAWTLAPWSAPVFAQQASIIGVVTDATQGVLPGVTVTATNLANGQVTVSVTTATGEYRLQNLQPGAYSVQAELPGFSSSLVPKVELLLG